MNDYLPLPEPISQALLDRAAALSSAQLCDGMSGLGISGDGCLDRRILPVDDSMRFVGTACTVETEEGDNFPIHVAIYQGKPGYVLMVAGGGYDKRAYMGDLMAGAAHAVGFAGVVVDGCVRDKVGLAELGLPIFSRGFMQRSPVKQNPGRINGEVTCGGVRVAPGDLVFGDYDGVTVVPRDRLEEVLERAEKKSAYEVKRRAVIEDYRDKRIKGLPLPVLAPDWVLDMLNKK